MSNQYKYWTTKTAFCFERKCRCEGCSEIHFCIKTPYNNYLNLKPLKYAAIQTYKNIGLYGFQEALSKIGSEEQ